jgi:VanZ like family/Concanavalin A-like lectin/glucanases superfamily
MQGAASDAARRRSVGALCILVLGIIAIAGLWPFHAPRNNVSWIDAKNGLRFAPYATVVSAKPFHLAEINGDEACSLEIWLAPGPDRKGTILAFGSANNSRVPFTLRQVGENLGIERYIVDGGGKVIRPWLTVERVFQNEPFFLTITARKGETRVYVNGSPAQTSSWFGLEGRDFEGNLVLGTSTINDSWSGEIRGLAIYPRELSREDVSEHFNRWTSKLPLDVAEGEGPEVLYLFNERAGNIVHDDASSQGNAGRDLLIPSHYAVLHNPVLQSPLEHYRDRWSAAHYWPYWQDVCVNVAGFVPVGFCFATYLSLVKGWRSPAASAILIGFALSLTIEVWQAFLPTRNSSLTDVITNTLGTGLGTVVYRSPWMQRVWSEGLSYLGVVT